MPTERLCVCVDLDDTLGSSAGKYVLADAKCTLLLIETLGWHSPSLIDIVGLHDRIDCELIPEFGWTHKRYTLGWVRTYQHLCRKAGLSPDQRIVEELTSIVAAVQWPFGKEDLVPGARETLVQLQQAGHELRLVTIGEEHIQVPKLYSLGLLDFFAEKRIHCTTVKEGGKGAVFGRLLERPDALPIVMVGNSLVNDIMPALELRQSAIHVPCPVVWTAERPSEMPRGHWTARTITEVPDIVRRIVAGERPSEAA
ncbi:MAG: HAD family hydrolase [bacterium]